MSSRQVFSAIVYVLRTGIQWKALPREFGSASAVHQYFQNWYKAGFFQKLWQAGLAEYDGMHGIAWQWQSADGAMGKAPLATECVGPKPDRPGEKKDANAVCWSTAVDSRCRSPSAAPTSTTPSCWIGPWLRSWSNVLRLRDGKTTNISVWMPATSATRSARSPASTNYYPRVKSRAEERLIKYRYPDSKPRRWVVERTHSWLNRFRKLLVSFEKTEASYTALLQLAAALICWRQTIVIYG